MIKIMSKCYYLRNIGHLEYLGGVNNYSRLNPHPPALPLLISSPTDLGTKQTPDHMVPEVQPWCPTHDTYIRW